MQKINPDKLKTYLDVKNGRGVDDVADKFEVTNGTARKQLLRLTASGDAKVIGTRETGSRGRPSKLYRAA